MDVAPRKHLLLDYGQVISLPQPAGDLERLAALAGLPMPELAERYWVWREPYDRGGSARAYWSAVLGTSPDEQQLRQLAAQDVVGWMHLDPVALRFLEEVHTARVGVSLLSNAPPELAEALSGHEVFARFEHLLFSSELRLTKPDSRIYAAAIAQLKLEPADIVFVDDRPENVHAAAALGLVAIQYAGHQDIEAIRRAVLA